jgi:hypothetical protein
LESKKIIPGVLSKKIILSWINIRDITGVYCLVKKTKDIITAIRFLLFFV